MKIFDENSNFLGEFTEASEGVLTKSKDVVCDAFSTSIIFGIICFLAAPWWTLLAIAAIFVFKSIIQIIKFAICVVWWVIRLPFTLIFCRSLPEF